MRRACVNGSWTAINFSECTLHVGTKVSLLLWLPLLGTKKAVLSRTGAILRDVCNVFIKLMHVGEIIRPGPELNLAMDDSDRILSSTNREETLLNVVISYGPNFPNKREDSVLFSLNIKGGFTSTPGYLIRILLTTSK